MSVANVLLLFCTLIVCGERECCSIPYAEMLFLPHQSDLPVCEELRDDGQRIVTIRVASVLIVGKVLTAGVKTSFNVIP